LATVHGTPTAVSDGGTAVAAYGYTAPDPGAHAFRWTSGGLVEDLGFLPFGGANGYETVPHGISADGSVVAGTCTAIIILDGQPRPFRWTASGGMQQLAQSMVANGISADGSIVVGYKGTYLEPDNGPGRWTSDGTFQVIGSLSATAVSCNLDGSVVALNEYDPNSGDLHQHVLLWNDGVTVDLGRPAGWTDVVATAVSSDGSAVVGWGFDASGFHRAFRWTNSGGMQDLGGIPGYDLAEALGVSGNGSVVVGYGHNSTVQGSRAFLWTPWLGMVDLQEFLSNQGVDLAGWPGLDVAMAISPDGSAIVGFTGSFSPQAWIVRDLFPTPWTNMGHGLVGSKGIPVLAGTGSLVAGSPGALTLTSARASSLAALFVAFASTPAPFKGGLLVPVPVALTLPVVTDGAGSVALGWHAWPAGLPEGAPLYFQYAIQDAVALKGVALSNAVVVLTP
jgi:probable HAF family extracellular repeat protein